MSDLPDITQAEGASDAEDIRRLRERLHMPDLPYIDFSLRHDHALAIARWPLLRELDAVRPASEPHANGQEEAT